MLVHLVAALLQLPSTAPSARAQGARAAADTSRGAGARKDSVARRDSIRARRDSIRTRRDSLSKERRKAKRVPVTAEHLATAFADASAQSILTLARQARMSQDSALQSYDATTYQRVSAGMALTKFGRDRLAFRTETATRVQWRRGTGAYVDVTGSRTVVPIAGKSARASVSPDISPIPYRPGMETLWIGGSTARQSVDESDGIVHPLADGAEAFYRYESGDSVSFRLPTGRTVQLRELRVRPREPKWNLAVGSLWFDMSGGQLVRAAYRMAVPMDIEAVAKEEDPTEFDDVPRVLKPMLFPMTAQISAIGVEYGLYQGRFWLPRVQVAEGGAQMGFMRVPFKLEQKYQYENVNAGAPLPPIVEVPDSLRRRGGMSISVGTGGNPRGRRRRAVSCDETGVDSYVRVSRDSLTRVSVRVPCDSAKLANSPDLPASIYESGEEAFGGAEMEALVAQALSMGAQAGFAPQPMTAQLDRPRYNRVEGASFGVRADQQLGAGYSLHGSARIGVADLQPNIELSAARSDLRRTRTFTAYNRLVSASDWGNPLSLGSSISAFVFGKDYGFYYRATGVELGTAPDAAAPLMLSWSLFAEQERTATVRSRFSVAHAIGGSGFDSNLVARRGMYAGARTRLTHSRGSDPQGLRLFSDLRLEGAYGDSGAFGRLAGDVTTSHGIGNGAAALTLAAGTSVGPMPAQRFWYLGGPQTVRGQRPGAAAGNAFWMARGEVAHGLAVIRPVVFADFGWAGDRTQWRSITHPVSGVGAGFSAMDGLVRMDVARGIHPERKWRVDTYVEARF